VAKDDVLGFVDRGSFSTLTCFPGKELANNYSLNTVDICPVGALTSTDFRFKMRVWFLKESKSVCTESSSGCNTLVSSREGVIQRITPRRNDLVNDTWMTDSGRELYKLVKSDSRIRRPSFQGSDLPLDDAISQAFETLRNKKIGVVASCHSTLEEQFLIKRLVEKTGAKVFIRGHFGEDDGILLSADRTPNLRGALVTELTTHYPSDHLNELNDSISDGHIEALLVIGENLQESGVNEDNLKKVSLVFLGTHQNSTSDGADVVLPGLTVFEKSGSLINRSFFLQSFEQAIPGPAGLMTDFKILARLNNLFSEDSSAPSELDEIWKALSTTETSVLKGITFLKIKKGAIQLDGSKWEDLSFVEKEALHHLPAGVTAS